MAGLHRSLLRSQLLIDHVAKVEHPDTEPLFWQHVIEVHSAGPADKTPEQLPPVASQPPGRTPPHQPSAQPQAPASESFYDTIGLH